ncbi:MAG: hypothetical protein A2X97_02625 [Bdellovibrionales bacterium GWA1_52_35]|nr:MAG: hypothetical protein A2X97_02625 [Bdellovibrionales bacterium GWA1_52_35]
MAPIPENENETVFLTGATGLVGSRVLEAVLGTPDTSVILLIRSKGTRYARDRLPQKYRADPRVKICEGDLADFSAGQWRALGRVTRIIHLGAELNFDAEFEQSFRINVEGTRRILDFAQECQRKGTLKSMVYVSTAFVCGRRGGPIREEELDCGQDFRNSYEETKYLAELEVQKHQKELPIAILRPSIITGDSVTGRTSAFKAVYWLLRIYAKGYWKWAPGSASTVVDIVPVDFVARATVFCLFTSAALRRTLHLCGGAQGQLTAGEIGQEAARIFKIASPVYIPARLFRPLWLVLRLLVNARTRRILAEARVYRDYFEMNQTFETTLADQILAPAGISAPPMREYLARVLTYCRDSDWGRKV